MHSLTIHLHLQSPLLNSQLGGGDPNSSVGFHSVSGSTLRGAIISRYLAGRSEDAADPCFQRLFLNGSVRYLNGYPLATTGQRTLPVPLSWQRQKDVETDLAHDWAICQPGTGKGGAEQEASTGGAAMQSTDADVVANANVETDIEADTDRAWKSVGEKSFCDLQAGQAEVIKPTMQVNIHIAREDRQRPTADGAAIFRYDALAAGQCFASMIVADDAVDLEKIKSLLPDGIRLPLGGSRSAGYGWVTVHYPKGKENQPFTEPQTEWYAPRLDTIPSAPRQLIVTLLSDALIQDPETGAYCADLKPVLGVAAKQRFVRLHKVGGFNRKWNLPLPQAEAISAGSVFVYEYNDDKCTEEHRDERRDEHQSLWKRVGELVEQGIGNRRAEGFGRIAVNWQQSAEIQLTEQGEKKDENADVGEKVQAARQSRPEIVQSQALTEQIVKRLLRAQLDRLLLQAINTYTINRRGMRNAQLSRIRVVARHALEPHHLEKAVADKRIHGLADFLIQLKKSARDQLERARIRQLLESKHDKQEQSSANPTNVNGQERTSEEPYYDWLTQLAVVPDTVWTMLQVPDQRPTLGQIDAQLTAELAVEYAVRLIDGTAQLASREENNA